MRREPPGGSPYKGLTAYAAQDAEFFFGREGEREIVAANLVASRLTVLYGASGVGKSSLLHAGVARSLREAAERNMAARGIAEFVPVAFAGWHVPDVAAGVREAVHEAVAALGVEVPAQPSATLADDLEACAEAIGGELLLIFDQFEEYFSHHPDGDAEDGFDAQLARIVTRRDLRANVLIAMREDAITRLDRFKGRIPHLFDNYLRVRHLDRRAARAAIVGPLEQYNRLHPEEDVGIEDELVERVLDEVRTGNVKLEEGQGRAAAAGGDERIEAPFLQLVMTRLWDEERTAGSRTLRLATLERLQGAEQIVRSHLDDSLAELTPAGQDVAARIFRQLVTQSGMKVAYTPADLVEHAEVPEPEVRAVLDGLAQSSARILRAVADESGRGGVRYEIFHDVLAAPILDWRRRHVAEAQRAEDEARRRAAERTAQRERRRARIFRAVAIASGVFAAGVAVLAVLAVRAKQEAQSQRLAALSVSQLRVDPARSVRIALQALDRSETLAADEALRAALGASRVRTVFRAHRAWINAAAYSPDGRVASAGDDGTARVWDPANGRQLAVVRGHDGPVLTAQFDRRGERLITAGKDETVRVSDARTGRRLAVLRPDGGTLDASGLALSPDATRIATLGDADGGAHIWDPRTGRLLRTLGDGLNVMSIAFDSAGALVATGTDAARVHVWDARTGEEIGTLDVDAGETVTHVEFSPDGRRLVAGTDLNSYLWTRWRRGGKGASLTFDDEASAQSPHFSRDGRSFVTIAGGEARLWSPDGFELATLRGHRDAVLSANFSPDGARIVTASQDGTARVWSRSGDALAELHGHTDLVEDARFSPDGRTVVTAGADGSARVWDVSERSLVRGEADPIAAARFVGGERLVTAGFSDAGVRVRVWQVATVRLERERAIVAPGVAAGDDEVNAVAVRTDGERVAFGSQSGRVAVHDGGRKRAEWEDDGPVSAIDMSRDGRLVAAAVGTEAHSPGDPWTVVIRQTARGRQGRTVRLEGHDESLNSLRFSPDDRFVVSAGDDKTARIWRSSGGRALHVLRGHAGLVWSADWSSDGGRVVTAGNDGTVRIWNAADGKPVRVLSGFVGAANTAIFANGDRWILAGGNDGTTRIWEAGTGRPLAIMREHAVAVTSVAMRRDTILSASEDGDAKLYECQTCGGLDELRDLAERRLRFAS